MTIVKLQQSEMNYALFPYLYATVRNPRASKNCYKKLFELSSKLARVIYDASHPTVINIELTAAQTAIGDFQVN